MKKIVVILFFTAFLLSLKLADARTQKTRLEMELDSAQMVIANLSYSLEEQQPVTDKYCLGDFIVTYYCDCTECCGKTDGITKSGAKVQDGVTVAVDPSIIPLGTYIYIEGVGYRVAQDTGSAVKGNRIDVYVQSHEQALELGTKTTKVWRMTK